jgi:D-alanine-D-alanine ligase-like ATP-grasp enzyme
MLQNEERKIMHYFENTVSHRKPPAAGHRHAPWRVAVLANLKEDVEHTLEDPPDAGAEFDRRETVEAIARALELDGHWVHICIADQSLAESLTNLRPHICFNIAEGIRGDAREAQAPALCELLGIPYTASRVLTNALSLDKTQTKRVWASHGLPTPAFQEFRSGREPVRKDFRYPLFVKPAREGTGMGIDGSAVVHNERELRQRVNWVLKTYKQPALAEEFLPGREFTVGFIGNPGSSRDRRRPWLYNSQGYHVFPILELDNSRSVSPGIYSNAAKSLDIGEQGAPDYLCPANISRTLARKLIDLSLRAAEAVGALDVSRVDLRLDADGEPYLLEINTLPGLNPLVSDLCIMAAAEGMNYDVLIGEILYLGAERYQLPFERVARSEEARPLIALRERVSQAAQLATAPVLRAALRRNL